MPPAKELEEALRLARIEAALVAITNDLVELRNELQKNTDSTEELVTVWNSSKGAVSFIKAITTWAAVIAGGIYTIRKLLGY